MKKATIKSLKFKKETISLLDINSLKGGNLSINSLQGGPVECASSIDVACRLACATGTNTYCTCGTN